MWTVTVNIKEQRRAWAEVETSNLQSQATNLSSLTVVWQDAAGIWFAHFQEGRTLDDWLPFKESLTWTIHRHSGIYNPHPLPFFSTPSLAVLENLHLCYPPNMFLSKQEGSNIVGRALATHSLLNLNKFQEEASSQRYRSVVSSLIGLASSFQAWLVPRGCFSRACLYGCKLIKNFWVKVTRGPGELGKMENQPNFS